MADAPSLGDFFKSKGKKKIKASNLNKDTIGDKKAEEKKKPKSTEDGDWQEEAVEQHTMPAATGMAGKLLREEDTKVEEEETKAAWGKAKDTKDHNPSTKSYPSLRSAVASSSINIDDGSDAKINIGVSKNVFAALEGEDDEEDTGNKRPKEIKPAMVTKKKGEFEKAAVQREVDKYQKKEKKKAKAKASSEDEEEEDEDEEVEAEAAAEPAPAEEEGRKKKSPEKKEERKDDKKAAKAQQVEGQQPEEELEEDLKIQPDLAASKEKYKGRKRLPPKDIPLSEQMEEKENKPKQQPSGGKKKKFVVEETDKKLQYIDE